MSKDLLFSVTASDCEWNYFRGSGKGGQKRNKTSSGVRCKHKDSGAVGVSDDTRSQHQNKKIAFERMANSKQFKDWHRTQTAKLIGVLDGIEEKVDKMMQDRNLRIEVGDGKQWREME